MSITKELHELYPNGTRVTNKELKIILQQLYNKYNIKKAACATHIQNFGFPTKKCKLKEGDKRVDGVILLSLNKYYDKDIKSEKKSIQTDLKNTTFENIQNINENLSPMAKFCLSKEKEIFGDNPSSELIRAFRQGFIAALEADKVIYDMIMKMESTKPVNNIEN